MSTGVSAIRVDAIPALVYLTAIRESEAPTRRITFTLMEPNLWLASEAKRAVAVHETASSQRYLNFRIMGRNNY